MTAPDPSTEAGPGVLSAAEIAEGKRLLDAATEGPWYWGGYTDRNDVRLMSMASMRPYVLGPLRTLPCIIDSPDAGMVTTQDACGACRGTLARDEAGEPDVWEDHRCERTDLPGLSFRDPETHIMRSAATYAVKEVDYRADVVALDHPDAALIVWLRNHASALLPLAEVGREEGIVWLDGQEWRLSEYGTFYEDDWGDQREADVTEMDDPDLDDRRYPLYRLVAAAPGEPTGDGEEGQA